jgi:beta-1,4-mannooligosaccharide/beta-1,4-mannosyl-N-acetylglucosamine phosphorylase
LLFHFQFCIIILQKIHIGYTDDLFKIIKTLIPALKVRRSPSVDCKTDQSERNMTMNKTKYTIHAPELKNIPWEERPDGIEDVVWRFSGNPVIPRDIIPSSNSIFNSAVVPFENGFAGVFRCDDKSRRMKIHSGKSKDGLNWTIRPEPIEFTPDKTVEKSELEYAYDPRVCWIEDRYYVLWCNGLRGQPTIGVGYTYDFDQFFQLENAFLPFNRNGVPFPRKIGGKFAMLSRPSDNAHTPFGDIFYSQSPDMRYWGDHRFVMVC